MRRRASFSIGSLLCAWACSCVAEPASVTVTVNLDQPLHAISPYIYGSNHEVDGYVFRDARRLGGNRLTPYNWEIDASNAGKDYRHQNDRWLTNNTWWQDLGQPETSVGEGTPAGAVGRFHEESRQRGAYSLITVPMAGYVSADADGPTTEDDVAPSPRWVEAAAASNEPQTMSLSDGKVYADQFVSHLVDRFGSADTTQAIQGYSLDNEPALWHKTHPRLHPEQVTVAGLIEKSIATAKAIKSVDPAAETFGPALWGITAYASLSKAPDWAELKSAGGYDWFIDHYLDAMRRASEEADERLLDVLDVHWYTENPKGRAWANHEVIHAAKVMHEDGFVEDNWVGRGFARFLPLLPRLQESIDTYYPGTRIAISEYDWPMTDSIEGGLVQADALGAFGKHNVYLAAYHHYSWNKPDRYVGSAFALYRDFDGEGGAFGELALGTQMQGDADVSVYAARDEKNQRLHVVVVSRELEHRTPLELNWAEGENRIVSVEAWGFDGNDPQVRSVPGRVTSFEKHAVSLSVPPLTASHVVISFESE